MHISGLRSRLTALLSALIVSVGLLGLSSAPAWAAAGTITEFPLPQHGVPNSITTGLDGNVWFALQEGNLVGRITPAGKITAFPVAGFCTANKGCGAYGITSGPDGNLWVTEYVTNNIVRITTSGTFTVFHIPTTTSKPKGITAGPDGNVWFSEQNASKIGRITTG
jgi:virginiamycin B lyase